MENMKVAILGAGNSGQTHAAYFKSLGFDVSLYDSFQNTVDELRKTGTIELTGAINKVVPFNSVTDDMGEAVSGAQIIFIINPAPFHHLLAQKLAAFLNPQQLIFLNPSSTFGAFAFKRALESAGYTQEVQIAESSTSPFTCRLIKNGVSYIGAMKEEVLFSVFPSERYLAEAAEKVRRLLPCIKPVQNVIATSMDNTNPHVHVAPTILNCSWIESGLDFSFMHEMIRPTVEKIIMKMDAERLELGERLGLTLGEDLFSLQMQYEREYSVKGLTSLRDILRAVPAYSKIYAPHSLNHRYITEDVPAGLIPLADVGVQIGLPMEKTAMIIDICEKVLEKDFIHQDCSRTLNKLGLEGMSEKDIVHYAETGRK